MNEYESLLKQLEAQDPMEPMEPTREASVAQAAPDDTSAAGRHSRIPRGFRILSVVLAAVLLVGAVFGIRLLTQWNSVDAHIAAYADTEILITGLTDEPFTVTPRELSQLELVTATAVGQTQKAGTIAGVGPDLETFLAQYGHTASDFKKIRILCADDYKVVLRREYLTDYQIILAICRTHSALPAAQQPMRLIIPDGESGKWAYAVTEIDFVE